MKGSEKRKVEVLTIVDLQKEYLLVKAKLRLLKKDLALATQLSSMSLTSHSNNRAVNIKILKINQPKLMHAQICLLVCMGVHVHV